MRAVVSYNRSVREKFANPRHAGSPRRACACALTAAVAESGAGARISLAAGIDGGVVTELSYRVFGCPHLIAALETFCSRHEGGPAAALENPDFADITRELEVPVEKSGRILLLEDAVAVLWSQYTGADQQGN